MGTVDHLKSPCQSIYAASFADHGSLPDTAIRKEYIKSAVKCMLCTQPWVTSPIVPFSRANPDKIRGLKCNFYHS